MAVRTNVTLSFTDDYGKRTTRSYQSRDANPSDAAVQDLAAAAQALSALSVTKAVVSREVDVSAQSDAAESKASRQKDASLVYVKSQLRNSTGGQYTFNVPEPKAAIVNPDGTVDLTAAAVTGWRERFDDGAGVAAVVGNWYVSDGEELVEEQAPVAGYLNKR